jgi:flagellin-like protein
MNLKQLFNDDDAVSPVIGVILMVAITVILAAVIASFVLGLGDQNNPAPTVNFEFSYDSTAGSDGEVVVTHGDGDEVNSDNLYIRGEQIDESAKETTKADPPTWTNINGGQTDVSAGKSVTIVLSNPGDEYVLNVVWEDPGSDSTSTLSTDRGPAA